uniref:Myotubularin phosphatase domain-containing protein n=1 Tax=Arcella intermedia TaxID=1963864 RepID=A0A6B2L1C5_9EUKA
MASLLKYRTKKEKSKKSVVLEIECKNFRIVRFRFEKGDTNYDNMIKVLEFYMEPGVEDLFAFSFSYSKWKSKHLNGWEIYDPVLEFHRLGIRNEPMNETQNRYSQKWRITNFNHGNKVIQSYPKYLVVPASEDDNSLKKKLWLRKDNCIPVLSWIHPNSGAAILRSSQPTPLHQHKQSDTEYLVSIKKVSLNNLRIYDLRTKTAAQITKSPISGEEDEAEGGIKSLTFLDLSDSETLLHSISIICEAIYSHFDQSTFWQKIVESGWLDIQSKLLFSANMIIKVVDELNESVLLYCCDGSNQTPLLLSTVLLMLDPYYRTIKGFIILIEKEWISYGHKFSSNFNSQQPFFLSWMDATYQLLVQNPCAFEFNHNFLIYLMDELFSCRFGTFIYDSDYERNEHNLSQKTISIWSSVLDPNRMSSFTNPFYQLHPKKMVAQFEQGNLKLWEYFIRYTSMDCKENPVQEAITPETKAQQLMDHNLKLQKQIQVLEKQLANASTAIIKSTSTSKITNPRISRGSPHKIGFKRNTSQRLLESDKT